MTQKEQKKLRTYIITKTKRLFAGYTAPAHGYDHAERVRKWIVLIAKAEKANVWLCEIIAVMHDIGRTEEKKYPKMTHHELSYQMCQKWFRDDRSFDILTEREKFIILYALRYHWNSFADQYQEAIILRDADKIDALGKIGVRRSEEYFGKDNSPDLLDDFRKRYEMLYHLRTKKARTIAVQKKLIDPINKVYIKLLKEEDRGVEIL